MDVRLEVPHYASEALRSGIYSFISRFAERTEGVDPYFSITIVPSGTDFIYHLKFATAEAGAAFVAYLPTVFRGEMTAMISTA